MRAFVVALSGIIIALPGFTFTIAIAELSTNNLLSGASRLLGGFMTVLQLGFGLVVGNQIAKYTPFGGDVIVNAPQYPLYVYALILPPVILTFATLFGGPRYPLAWFFTFLDCYAAVFSTALINQYTGREVGALIGSALVGIIGNVFSRISKHPSLTITS